MFLILSQSWLTEVSDISQSSLTQFISIQDCAKVRHPSNCTLQDQQVKPINGNRYYR